MINRDELVALLVKEISYDADGGDYCPACKYELRPKRFWWYHHSTTKTKVMRFLGIRCEETLSDIWEETVATGNEHHDAKVLADEILRRVFL